MTRVLLVDDEAALRDMVSYTLEKEGLKVETCTCGEEALERFGSDGYFDLVILDLMLPGMDGFELCREFTGKSTVPVIMLTARSAETDVVVGLELGADDYITKPFSRRELASRVRAHLRRRNLDAREPESDERLRFPGLTIDLVRHRVLREGEEVVSLTSSQFAILGLLASHPGRVFSRGEIMEPIWGTSYPGRSRAADVQIQNIRRAIEPDPKNPRYILTVRGAGYRFAGD